MRTKFHTAFAIALSTLVALPAHAQPEEEIPIEEGELDEAGEEVPPSDEGEQAPPPGEGEGTPQAPPDQAPPAETPVEEVPEDEFMEEAGEDPTAPPPKGKGVVWGVLRDSNGEPVIEGPVEVVGTKTQVITDFDGRYRLELPPGKYSLRFFYEFHQPLRVEVNVELGEVEQVDAELEAEADAEIETFPIETKLEEASIESQNLKRQRSAAVTDGIGREEISKTPDSDAAAAAQRVVGANVEGGRFVYVRGLGERYSNSLLFGAPLPSPEPDKAAVPLDLFPALVLDSLNIAKTFTPDMPGDFAGGSVQIETRGVPEDLVFSVSLSGAYNTQATFKDRLDYPGSSTDWLGFDDGSRDLPPEIPRDFRAFPGAEKPDGSAVTREDLVGPGRALNTRMSPTESFTPPDHGLSVVAGNGWLLGGKQKLGVLGSVNYSHSYTLREDEILREFQADTSSPQGFAPKFDYKVDRGGDQVGWGTFGSVAYQPNEHHELRLMGLHSQSSDKSTNVYEGFDDNTDSNFAATQFIWVERGLTLGQLSGRHTFDPLNGASLGWDAALARAVRSEPDRRDTVYNGRDGIWAYRDGSESGRHFFADQDEVSTNLKLDYTQPIVDATSVKAGGLVALKDRTFDARRFAFRRNPTSRDPDLTCDGVGGNASYPLDCPDRLFQNDNIDAVIQMEEGSEAGDSYEAHLNVYAGYLMGDAALSEQLRAFGGARVEKTDQAIEPFNPFGGSVSVAGAELESMDWLPALGLVFSATSNAKTRFSYGRTLARPQLRELAPFAFSDYFGGKRVSGNPNLTLTTIDNYDMRFEYFPSLRETLAFSIFFKDFKDPIEPVLVPSGGQSTLVYRNAEAAKLLGLELEARKDLYFLSAALKDFTLVANLTLVWSRTEVEQTGSSEDGVPFISNPSRPLVNQAPWVVNLQLDYENEHGTGARALYNVSGRALVEVGTQGMPDAYRQPMHSVDLVASQDFLEKFQAKIEATNVLNAKTLVTQGETPTSTNATSEYREGVTVGLGLSYTH